MDFKYFDRWSAEGVEVDDPGLRRYIRLEPKLVPHAGGRHANKQFGKADAPIVERLINKIMRSGSGARKIRGKVIRSSKNCGKKHKAYKIVKKAFERIEDETGKNPVQVLVDAIQNSAPREETTKISYGGITYHVAVDSSPQRKLDVALKNLADGAYYTTFKGKKSIEECLAEELISASSSSMDSFAISEKENVERIAKSAR